MAKDWTAISHELPNDPIVMRIARWTGKPPDEILGILVRYFVWVQNHATDEGILAGMDAKMVATASHIPVGVARGLVEVDWLRSSAAGLEVVRFDRWLSEKARARLMRNRRQQRWRSARNVDAPVDARAPPKCAERAQIPPHTPPCTDNQDAPVNVCAEGGGSGGGTSATSAPTFGSTNVSTSVDQYSLLQEWCKWWNGLHAEGLVCSGVNAERPSLAVRAGWKRVLKSRELQELLGNRKRLKAAIKASKFCREGWFGLPSLFGGRNKMRELFVEKLIQGRYSDGAKQAESQQLGTGDL